MIKSKASVKLQGEAFNAEDLKSMPDLTQILSSLDLENMTPPNTKELDRLKILRSGANGWYTKVGNRVYGIVRVSWTMCPKDQNYLRYFDDIYYLATSDGQYRQISRQDLQRRIGSDPNISTYGYNEPMSQPVA